MSIDQVREHLNSIDILLYLINILAKYLKYFLKVQRVG
jgi:hypothetical protein